MMGSRLRLSLALLTTLLCAAIACSQPEKTLLFTGQTMGTTYHITVTERPGVRSAGLHARIDQRLERLNQSMSTYLPDSEISRFNRSRSVDRAFPVSTDFYAVMAVAAEVYRISKGTWDGTVEPLVKLWGFGSPGAIDAVPSRQSIAEALGKVGFDHIDVSGPGAIKKGRPDIAVDLASIAKGYGVDAVARLLGEAGFKSYLVEIGGEVYAAGRRPDGMPWKVGINQPDMSAPANAVYMALALENQAMATSGDYRNYIEIEGRTYSHIIDPRSGYPVRNGVVSASVIAPTCTLADGLATALMVMGPREGLALLDRLDQVEGLIIVRRANGVLHNHWSRGLKP